MLLLFMLLGVTYGMRVNMSVGIVAMVDKTANHTAPVSIIQSFMNISTEFLCRFSRGSILYKPTPLLESAPLQVL